MMLLIGNTFPFIFSNVVTKTNFMGFPHEYPEMNMKYSYQAIFTVSLIVNIYNPVLLLLF